MFRFIHAADLHLDSPLHGLRAFDGAPVERLRSAPRRALENLVDFAIEQKVSFLLIAGDVFDGDWKDYGTGQFFVRQMARLRECDIPVYLISGNHDAQNKMTRALAYPSNVHVFPTDRPDTVRLDALEVAIHGQGFANQSVTEDLSANYPKPIAGWINIGLLHTSCTGREGHENYAPCTIEGLRSRGYDYWALGHIHKREELLDDPWIIFPGNIQGRHAKETGPKGCYLLNVDEHRRITPTFHPIDDLRWEYLPVDVSEIESINQVQERFVKPLESLVEESGEKLLAIRVALVGQTAIHRKLRTEREFIAQECQAIATGIARDRVWIEKVEANTSLPKEVESESAVSEDVLAAILGVLEEAKKDPSILADFSMDDVRGKLPLTLRSSSATSDSPLTNSTSDWLMGKNSILESAKERLIEILASQEENV
jgi:DNA repair exonuclease SbcCD nuclease subunit